MNQMPATTSDEPVEMETAIPQRRSVFAYIPCVFLVLFGLGMAVVSGALFGMSLYNPQLMDFPVTPYTLFAIFCGLCAGLAWIASGILFYVRKWRWALLLLLLGYGLGAFSYSVTSPAAN